MKKAQKIQFEYKKIKNQYPHLKDQVSRTKSNKLRYHESAIRNRIRELSALPSEHLSGYEKLHDNYLSLLDEVSERLLQNYNRKNGTDYEFEKIIASDYEHYVQSGIISVLITSHIPQMVAAEYNRLLPKNPKDEYPLAREMKRKFFLHLGETNTGKTYQALQRLKQSKNGIYLSPLRILALENYERLNEDGVACNLFTGEEEILVDGARHASCTVEKVSLEKEYDVAVIDEVQMLADSQRGDAWTRAILGLRCKEIHLCGAMLAKEQLFEMIDDCGDTLEFREYSRLVPLQTEKKQVRLSDVQKGDALVAFSKKRVLSLSQYYTERGIKNSVIYGDLPPEVRKMQYNAFISGENPILISTDAIGMGVNLPIRRIIFTALQKFDGVDFRLLTSQEVKQIAGRAGRIGIYEVGYVACLDEDIDFVEDQLDTVDDDIGQAVVGPSEIILRIGILPLKEKLALWSTREESLPYYRKKDVQDYLLILEKLKPYKLPEPVQWKLMNIPFDVGSDNLFELFLDYVEECFWNHADELSKPEMKNHTLPGYEEYYQKVNLYYGFSKSMNLDFDQKWVENSREKVSEKINALLSESNPIGTSHHFRKRNS